MRRVGRAAAGVVAVALLGVSSGAAPAGAAQPHPVVALSPERLVQLARPATVLVRTKLKAKVTSPGEPTQETVTNAVRTDPAFIAAAQRRDEKGVFDALFSKIAKEPARFTSGSSTDDVDIEATGSGFVIQDGTVMTNSHVVYGEDAAAGKAAIEKSVGSVDDIATALTTGIKASLLTVDLVHQAAVALRDHVIANSKADGVSKVLTIERAARSGPVTLTATTSKAGAEYPGEDLALLKVADLSPVEGRSALLLALSAASAALLLLSGAGTALVAIRSRRRSAPPV